MAISAKNSATTTAKVNASTLVDVRVALSASAMASRLSPVFNSTQRMSHGNPWLPRGVYVPGSLA